MPVSYSVGEFAFKHPGKHLVVLSGLVDFLGRPACQGKAKENDLLPGQRLRHYPHNSQRPHSPFFVLVLFLMAQYPPFFVLSSLLSSGPGFAFHLAVTGQMHRAVSGWLCEQV